MTPFVVPRIHILNPVPVRVRLSDLPKEDSDSVCYSGQWGRGFAEVGVSVCGGDGRSSGLNAVGPCVALHPEYSVFSLRKNPAVRVACFPPRCPEASSLDSLTALLNDLNDPNHRSASPHAFLHHLSPPLSCSNELEYEWNLVFRRAPPSPADTSSIMHQNRIGPLPRRKRLELCIAQRFAYLPLCPVNQTVWVARASTVVRHRTWMVILSHVGVWISYRGSRVLRSR